MKPVDFSLSVVRIPLARPFVTALRRVESVEAVRLELLEERGAVGAGEAPATVAVTGEGLDDIAATLSKRVLPALLGRPFASLTEALDIVSACCEGHGSAKAAADMALHDLWMKLHGPRSVPYLAAKEAKAVTDVTVSLGGPEEMASEASFALKKGCDILKVKVGGGDGLDIQRVEAVREAAPSAKLLVDANQAWSEEEAHRVIASIAPLDIALVEQPLPAGDLEGMRRVTQMSGVPILADESVFTLEDAIRVIEGGCADMVNVKLMKCGGISKAAEILAWCEAREVGCMIGSMLETPLSIAAALRLAARFEACVRFVDLDSPLLYAKSPETSALTVEGNLLRLKV